MKISDEVAEKLKQAKERMKKKGVNYDGLGQAIDKINEENGEEFQTVYLEPKTELELQRVKKEIKENLKDDE